MIIGLPIDFQVKIYPCQCLVMVGKKNSGIFTIFYVKLEKPCRDFLLQND